jgi:hypothetical protein
MSAASAAKRAICSILSKPLMGQTLDEYWPKMVDND